MTVHDTEVLALFEQEAAERLTALGSLLLQLEADGLSDDLIGRLFREAHTLKGAANVVGFTQLGAEAHALEDLFDGVRAGTIPVTNGLVDEMLAAVDRLASLCGLVVEEQPPPPEPVATEPVVPAPGAALLAPPPPMPAIVDEGPAPVPVSTRHDTARVSIDRLDDLVRLAGESAAAHLRLAELVRKELGIDPYMVAEMRVMSRLLTDLQERALRARMLPIGAADPALRRAVRDLSRRTGKAVTLEFRGEDTELDRTVHERLVDALIHIVRNAVDHGIEAPEDREAAGKSLMGTIVVHAMQLGPRVVITVTDDGAGVDVASVRTRAEALGIDCAGLRDDDVLDLLFHPGLTTTTEVTDLSGRGVGLDAVRESLAALRGRVEVESTAGEGTVLRISVPITLTVVRGLIVRIGGQRYAIPMSNVLSVAGRGAALEQVEGRPAIRVGGSVIGVTPLGDVLGVEASDEGPVVAVTGVSKTHAFCVDALEGERDVLLKNLPAVVPASDLVVGASAEPDASVMLVLDAEALVEQAERLGRGPVRRLSRPEPAEVARTDRILVVDDALTVRELQRTILARAGYQVTTAGDGQEALAVIDQAEPDLVMTDVEMPVMDGLELVRAIRAHPRWSNVPVVILTSRGDDVDRQAGMDAGADAYIVKSAFDEAALLTVVDNLLGVAVGA